MKFLIDTSILVEAERQNFDLGGWLQDAEGVHMGDATVTEYLAGQPLKDEGKRKRWREFCDTTVKAWGNVSGCLTQPLSEQPSPAPGWFEPGHSRAGLLTPAYNA